MKEKIIKNKQTILIILGVIIALIIILFKIFGGSKDSSKIEIVRSSSKFYTVSNCVSRYLNYLYSEDTDNILLLLNSTYKKNNNINSNNLFDKISKLDDSYDFEARKMYEKVINEHIVKYYVYGYLSNNYFDYDNQIEYYIIIYLNSKDFTYSVEPYDGNIFKNGDNDEKK